MIKNIIISIIIFLFMYISYKLIKMYDDKISSKKNDNTDLAIDLVICDCDNATDVKACVILINKEFDMEELNKINKTLIENHRIRIYTYNKNNSAEQT